MKKIAWWQVGYLFFAWVADAFKELFWNVAHWRKAHPRAAEKIERALFVAAMLVLVALVCSRTVRKQESAKYAAALQAVELRHTAELERIRTDVTEELKTEYGLGQEIDQIQAEAELLARLAEWLDELGTSERGKKSAFWCVFNRTDSSQYPDTIESVLSQPGQFDGFKADRLYTQGNLKLALQEVRKWHSTAARPMRADFLYLSWFRDGVVLKTQIGDGKGCHYFYETDWDGIE